MAASADYDAPRWPLSDDASNDSLQILTGRATNTRSGPVDADETDLNEALELPGADLSNLLLERELTVRVVPMQTAEFACASCFLITPRTRLAHSKAGRLICRDCA